MKLIIDISEGSYNTIKECYERGELLTTICMQIATGTPYEEITQGEWIDYNNTFYKCPECGYLLEKCCPQCQNKVILPKGGTE